MMMEAPVVCLLILCCCYCGALLIPTRLHATSVRSRTAISVHTSNYECSISRSLADEIHGSIDRPSSDTLQVIEYAASQSVVGGSASPTTVIVLIHPIGVGIGRWYYDRLLAALSNEAPPNDQRTVVIAPDLLACGSANQIKNFPEESQFPLLRVNDWSTQIVQLMQQWEHKEESKRPIEWCIVSNGGCVPIALEAAAQYIDLNNTSGQLTHVVLSATPSLTGLIREPPPDKKVIKSFRLLSGVVGRLFWWYSLRKEGKFIEKFTKRNLMAQGSNVGDEWTATCVKTAKMPNTRYSTFMFLAGALQHDCRPSFAKLSKRVKVGIITGGDKRSNPARSWFWTGKRRKRSRPDPPQQIESLSSYLMKSGSGGDELVVGGRRCPAYEDATGFAKALYQLLST